MPVKTTATHPLLPSELLKFKQASAAADATAWNKACDEVKAARGGQYPPDWVPLIIRSGLASF